MSSHKLLSHTENGYIVRCNNCQDYQIAFGTIIISLSAVELSVFQKEVSEQLNYFPYDGFHDQKIIQLFLSAKSACMILNYLELVKLSNMLTEANLLEQVEAILFNSNFDL